MASLDDHEFLLRLIRVEQPTGAQLRGTRSQHRPERDMGSDKDLRNQSDLRELVQRGLLVGEPGLHEQ